MVTLLDYTRVVDGLWRRLSIGMLISRFEQLLSTCESLGTADLLNTVHITVSLLTWRSWNGCSDLWRNKCIDWRNLRHWSLLGGMLIARCETWHWLVILHKAALIGLLLTYRLCNWLSTLIFALNSLLLLFALLFSYLFWPWEYYMTVCCYSWTFKLSLKTIEDLVWGVCHHVFVLARHPLTTLTVRTLKT